MPDLLSYATDEGRERDGVWFTPRHLPAITFLIVGQGHPDAAYLYARLYRELRLERDAAPDPEDPELWLRYWAWFVRDYRDTRSEAESVADPITVGGEPLAYSPEQARTILRQFPRVRNELRVAIESSGLFRPPAYDLRADEGGLGNSGPSSTGPTTGEDGMRHGSET